MARYTIELLLIDSATNISNLSIKLLSEKNTEKRDKIFARLSTLNHDFLKYMHEYCVMNNLNDNKLIEVNKLIGNLNKINNILEKDISEIDKELWEPYMQRFLDSVKIFAGNNYSYGDIDCFTKFVWNGSTLHNPCEYDEYRIPIVMCNNFACDKIEDIILKSVNTSKQSNIMFSNFEYMKDLKNVYTKFDNPENVRLYAGYAKNCPLIDMETRRIFSKVAIGNTANYFVRNNRMDLVIHRFEYHLKCHDYADRIQDNKIQDDLTRIWRYLKDGGIVLFIMPDFMLNSKVCLSIADKYKFLGYFKDNHNGFLNDRFQYCVFALKKKMNIPKEEINDTFMELMGLSIAGTYSDFFAGMIKRELPKSGSEPLNIFKGPEADIQMMEIILQDSPLFRNIEKKKIRQPKPLLPFKKSQIGQVLASGKLDGVIDEGNGYKHVIRGVVNKGTRVITETDDSDPENIRQTVRTLTNNMVEINLIAGDGTYKTIAMTG